MATVGRMAGVSQVTVSRALSEPDKVSADTLRRIHSAIEQTGFVPNAIAGALASQRSRLISALVPSLTNVVYSSFVKTFSDSLREAGYQLLLSETGFEPEEELKAIASHLSRRPDAILLTGIHHSAQARKMLLGADIPVVEAWDITDTPIDMCVGFSHVEASRAVADYVMATGYTQAATVTANDERAHRRRDAFAARMTSLGGTPVAAHDCEGPASIASGRAALSDLIEREALRTGVIFCSSDVLAQGLLIEAQACEINVPGNLAIIGFGDQEFAAHLEPALTTVRVDRNRLGKEAADTILTRLNGGEKKRVVVDLGFEIVTRASA
ncbi:LacI family DNA-binding transcriptional regulator [Rhodobacterales bacterium]|nr:LacI family DNA-binding transcriptional regulator [Rhodobacterales bacterium]